SVPRRPFYKPAPAGQPTAVGPAVRPYEAFLPLALTPPAPAGKVRPRAGPSRIPLGNRGCGELIETIAPLHPAADRSCCGGGGATDDRDGVDGMRRPLVDVGIRRRR